MGSTAGYTMAVQPLPRIKTLQLFDESPYNSNSNNPSSEVNLEDPYEQASDCESGISSNDNMHENRMLKSSLIRVQEEDKMYGIIKNRFVSSLSNCGLKTEVVAIHKKDFSSAISQAKYQSFALYARAMEQNFRGGSNVKFAWYGGPKNQLDDILEHGFGHSTNLGVYGGGICLSPADHPIASLQSSVADEDGLRHVILCRVLLGRTEIVHPYSQQSNPSSEEFDSGVDNLTSPKKYIFWSTRVNTHILPEYVVSFRVSAGMEGRQNIARPLRRPSSDFIPFPILIKALSKFLPPDAIKTIEKYYGDHKEKKMTRHELIQHLRNIAGDKLLLLVIKSHMDKMKASQISFLRNVNNQGGNSGLRDWMASPK